MILEDYPITIFHFQDKSVWGGERFIHLRSNLDATNFLVTVDGGGSAMSQSIVLSASWMRSMIDATKWATEPVRFWHSTTDEVTK